MAETAAVVFTGSSLKVKLPMTQPTGKIRIKRRSFFSEYGMPVASRSECLDLKCYIEWQIGYDLLATSANSKTLACLTSSFPITSKKRNLHMNYRK